MNKSITELQSIIDEHKQSLPEDAYLQLCNQMKSMYEEQKDREGIYEIDYQVISILPERMTNEFRLKVAHKKRLLELNEEEYNLMWCASTGNTFINNQHPCADIFARIEPLHQQVYVRPSHDEIKDLEFDEILPSSVEDIEDGIRQLSIHLGFQKTINLIGLKRK